MSNGSFLKTLLFRGNLTGMIFSVLVLLAVFIGLIYSPNTYAADATQFKAGRIIDDVVFTDNTSMNASQIQNFLDQQNSACLKNFRSLSLKDLNGDGVVQDSTTEKYGGNSGTETMSAAELIAAASQIYRINPKVILVTLQKEQGLITRLDCPSWRYNTALGYGCPDTAACDQSAFGFTRQIDYGAYHFRGYFDDTLPSVPFTTGPQSIGYNPNASCGSSVVNIENRATASLYSYTPYQPNSAALAAGYGQATCGAYGNRNFWLYFNDWFGNPLGPDYQATFYKQSGYESGVAGTYKTIYFMFKNTGRLAWGDNVSAAGYNPVRLATDNPINRISPFADESWLSPQRTSGTFSAVYESDGTTLTSDQHVVNTGEIVKLSFKIKIAPEITPGTYSESFVLIREGASDWAVPGGMVWTQITVLPTYEATFSSQSDYPTLKANEMTSSWISYKNTGNMPWYDDTSVPQGVSPVHLATSNILNRKSIFGQSWPSSNRPSGIFNAVYEADGVTLAANQHIVNPGQIGKFEFTLTAPIHLSSGTYKEYFQPILEGAQKWNIGGQAWLDVTSVQAPRNAAYYKQSDYPTIRKSESSLIYFMFKNIGQTKWYDDLSAKAGIYPTHIATASQINRQSSFTSNQWVSSNRPSGIFNAVYEADGVTLAANQHIVNPGQIGKFEFTLTAPASATSSFYREYFQPVFEGGPQNSWNPGGQVWIGINVIN